MSPHLPHTCRTPFLNDYNTKIGILIHISKFLTNIYILLTFDLKFVK